MPLPDRNLEVGVLQVGGCKPVPGIDGLPHLGDHQHLAPLALAPRPSRFPCMCALCLRKASAEA